MNISHVESCDVCGGTGCEPGTTAEVCPECHGSGQVRMQQRTMFGTMSTSTVCPNCRGEGKIIHQKCKACGGSGGGKPDCAMGGGKDPLKLDDALASVDDFVAVKLGL